MMNYVCQHRGKILKKYAALEKLWEKNGKDICKMGIVHGCV